MRKSLLFLLMAMLMPVFATAQTNQAFSKTHATYTIGACTETRVIVPAAAAGLTMPMQQTASYAVGMWFNLSAYHSHSSSWGKESILASFGTTSHMNYNGNWCFTAASDGTLKLYGHGGDNNGVGTYEMVGSFDGTTISLNDWHYLLFSVNNDNNTVDLYFDGALVKHWDNAGPLNYGGDKGWADGVFQFGSFGFSGAIDEINVFNAGLTSDEAIVARINPTALSKLSGHYTFDDATAGLTNQATGAATGTDATYVSDTFETIYTDDGLITRTATEDATPSLIEGRTYLSKDANVTLTEGEGGTFSAANAAGNTFATQDEAHAMTIGDLLTLTATPAEGYDLVGYYVVKGETTTQVKGNTVLVTGDETVTARFTDEHWALTVDNALNVPYTLTFNGETVTDLTNLLGGGAEYQLTLEVPDNMVLNSVTLGSETLTAVDGVYSFFMDAASTLTINATQKAQRTITFDQPANGTISVTTGSGTSLTTLTSGSTVADATVITISVTANAGYSVSAIKVNGTTISGNTYTVMSDVTITAEFEKGIEHCTPVHNFNKTTAGRSDRYISQSSITDGTNTITLNSSNNGALGNSSSRKLYDASATILTLNSEPGKTITITNTGAGEWMQNYIFFDADLNGLDANDCVVRRAGQGGGCFAGTRTFTIPEDIEPGVHRVRYIVTWLDGDPNPKTDNSPCQFGQNSDNGDVVFDFDIVITKQELDAERTVTVASENDVYGTVAITNPATEGNTLTSKDPKVTVKATPAEGYAFRNWTNAAGDVVATTAEYIYEGTTDVELTANFGHTFDFTANANGTVAVSCNGEAVATGAILPVGSELEFTLTPATGKVLTVFDINGTDCLSGVADGKYTYTLDANTTATIEFGDVTSIVTLTVVGNGTVTAGYGVNENEDGTYSYNVEFTSGSMFSVSTFNANSGAFFMIATPGTYVDETVGTTQEEIETATATAGEDSNTLNPDGEWENAEGTLSYGFTISEVPTADTNIAFVFTHDGQSAIDEIFGDDVDNNAPVEYYNINGVRVNGENLAPGIYVVKKGDKTMKVYVM